MDTLPSELKREIAGACSLISLLNLQLISKGWAEACRGVGAKFRGISIKDIYDAEAVEIDLFVRKNVLARGTCCGGVCFEIRGNPRISSYAFLSQNQTNRINTQEDADKLVERESGA